MRQQVNETRIYCDSCRKRFDGLLLSGHYGINVGELYFTLTEHRMVDERVEAKREIDLCSDCYRELHEKIVNLLTREREESK